MKTPAKPLTPFFLFREKEKEKGNSLGGKDAAALWNKLTEEEKEPFYAKYKKNKEAFDEYLAEEGYSPKRSSVKKPKDKYLPAKIRGLLGENEEVKEMSSKQYAALGKMTVRIFSYEKIRKNLLKT